MSRTASTKAASRNDITEEQYVQIEEAICTYLEENPDADINNSSTLVTLRSKLGTDLNISPVKLVKPINDIVRKLTQGSKNDSKHNSANDEPKPKAESTKPKISRRSVDVDPKSQSESDAGSKPRQGRQPRGAVKGKDDIDSSNKSSSRRQPASANKANADDAEVLAKYANPLPNILDRNCCTVDSLPYNFIADAEIDDFDADPDFFEAIEEYFNVLVPSIADEFMNQCRNYLKTLRGLHEKYPTCDKTIDGKLKKAKPQQFKYTRGSGDKKPCVKYTNPADLKVGVLPASDAKPIIKFNEYVETTVAKAMPAFGKSKTKKAESEVAPPFDWMGLLNSRVVYTAAILGAAWFKKMIPNADAKFVKPLGFFLHEGCPGENEILAAIKSVSDIEYVDLFKAISKIPSAKMPAVAKNIYLARHKLASGILTEAAANSNWIQAMNNILGITDEMVSSAFTSPQFKDNVTQDDLDIIHTWQNVMRSRFVYYIVARGAPANPIFEKAIIQLATHPTSIRLFMTALYPIACYFTPFHCYYPIDSFTMEKFPTNVTPQTYFKHIKSIIASLMTARGFDIKQAYWVFYSKPEGTNHNTNLMIALLGPYVLAKPGKKPGAKAGAKAKDNFMDDPKSDDDDDNTGDEGSDEGNNTDDDE